MARYLGLFLLVIAAATTGCASTLHGTTQEVGFRSVPPGATVAVSGQSALTPAKIKLSRDKEHTVTFTKDGHPERQANLKQKLDGAFYGNIALGGIIGMAVDMSNGAAYRLSPGNVEMDMASGIAREFDEDEPVKVAEAAPLPAYPAAVMVTPATASPLAQRSPPAPLLVQDTGLRYVAPNKGGGGFVLWANLVSFNNCIQALTRGAERDRRMFCEDGVAGMKPKVGEVEAGTEVELLDSKECGNDMTHVRVLAGSLRGETGCLAPIGLTRIKS